MIPKNVTFLLQHILNALVREKSFSSMCIRIFLWSFWRAKSLNQRLQSAVKYSKFVFSIWLWYIPKDSTPQKAFNFQINLLNGKFLHLSDCWTDLGITAEPHDANISDFCTSEANLPIEKSGWCSEVAVHFVEMVFFVYSIRRLKWKKEQSYLSFFKGNFGKLITLILTEIKML